MILDGKQNISSRLQDYILIICYTKCSPLKFTIEICYLIKIYLFQKFAF